MCLWLCSLSVKLLVSQGVCVHVCVCSLSVKLLVGRLCQGMCVRVCVLSAPCGPTLSGSVSACVCALCQLCSL